MSRFANRRADQLSFYQWINVEYGLVKGEYKTELTQYRKERLKEEYKQYLAENK